MEIPEEHDGSTQVNPRHSAADRRNMQRSSPLPLLGQRRVNKFLSEFWTTRRRVTNMCTSGRDQRSERPCQGRQHEQRTWLPLRTKIRGNQQSVSTLLTDHVSPHPVRVYPPKFLKRSRVGRRFHRGRIYFLLLGPVNVKLNHCC